MNLSYLCENCTEEQRKKEFLLMNLGEVSLAMETLLPLTVIYSVFFVIGLCGNLATCIVILKNEYMRTATNVYLLNLAVTDMATLVLALPSELYLYWHQYPWVFGHMACDFKIVVQEAITYVSILTIVSFSVERYLAICRPFSPRARSSPGKAKTIIVRIWIISFLSACPWARYTKVNYLIYDGVELEESSWCSIPFNEENIGSLYLMLASTLVYFLVPMITVSVLYIRIGMSLSIPDIIGGDARDRSDNNQTEPLTAQALGRRQVVRMLVVVVASFFICWSPFHSQRMMFVLVTILGRWDQNLSRIQHILFVVSGVFYYFNCTLNPFLYSVMSKRFRRAFTDIQRNITCRSNSTTATPVENRGTSVRMKRVDSNSNMC